MPVAPEYLHLVYPGPFPAYLYGRASHDPTKRGRSVAAQLHEGRELCELYGWPIVGTFDKDVDRSASRHAKRTRDDFEAMLDGIAAGKCRIVVAWEASRYYRDLEAYVRLRNACYEAGVLLCYNGAVYDLSKRADRKATAQDALQAEDEAEAISDRQLRTKRLMAEQGRPGGRTPFGYARRYDPDTGDLEGQYPHPERARLVAQAFAMVDSSQTTYAAAQWLEAQPHGRHPSGIPWDAHRIRSMLMNPAYVGKRVFRGEVIGDGEWEPISDDPEFEARFYRVQKILKDPTRLKHQGTRVKHLLSHLALCAPCGDHAVLTTIKGRRGRKYNCKETGNTSMPVDTLDAIVEEAVLTWLASDAAKEAFRPDTDQEAQRALAQARLTGLETQLKEAQRQATTFNDEGKPLLSVTSLAAIEAQLAPRIVEERAKVEAMTSPGMPPLVRQLIDSDDIEAMWDSELSLPQQRDVIRNIVTVRLNKASGRGVRTVEPGRVELSFVGQPGFRARPIPAREYGALRLAHRAAPETDL